MFPATAQAGIENFWKQVERSQLGNNLLKEQTSTSEPAQIKDPEGKLPSRLKVKIHAY